MLYLKSRLPSIARMSTFLYILACVLAPLAWGLIVVFVSNRIDQWAKAKRSADSGNAVGSDAMHVDYHI